MSGLIVHSREPLNAEPSLARLRERFVTGSEDFYVRTHGDIPKLDATRFRLNIGGLVDAPLELSLEALQTRFETRDVVAVMQCAGNRRADLLAVKKVSGDPWAPGAIGNARWTGVALADVLLAAGMADAAGLHVEFGGADEIRQKGKQFRFGVSIPIEKARAPEVILAWAMNGEPLRPEHGFPLRAVVPGYAGIRSAKWLTQIDVRESPAEGPLQADDYKLYPADVSEADADPARGMTIDEMPLNAAICVPADGAVVTAGVVTVRGYATAMGRGVSRVEVSGNGGQSWVQATIAPGGSAWSWVLWEAEVPLSGGARELAVRAWDGAGQTQPATAGEIWNFKGYLCNSWHRVGVTVTQGLRRTLPRRMTPSGYGMNPVRRAEAPQSQV